MSRFCQLLNFPREAQDKEEAVFAFDTRARVFRTGLNIPTSTSTGIAAIDGANGFYDAGNTVCEARTACVIKVLYMCMPSQHVTMRRGSVC